MVRNGTPLPAKLSGPPLSDREAITDACYRAFASIDNASEELLESCATPDVYTDIGFKICDGYEELLNKVWFNVTKTVDTVHYLSNVRVSVDTETTARVTFNAQAVHCIAGKGYDPDSTKFTTGSIYACDAVKVDDLWKLKKMKATPIWSTGDRSIMKPPSSE
ncbi:hypothetical protein N7528_009764 [Penicillium herquei]|nr:hypothetical protein N7528_009764 [Penicillium herquei]